MTEIQRLTPKERRFFYAYLQTGNQRKAFEKAFPTRTQQLKKPDLAGHRIMCRIKEKYDWDRLLAEAGLGYERIFPELRRMLRAKVVKTYKDQVIGIYADNATRMRALELLVDLHGKRKQVVEHTGEIKLTDAIIEADRRRRELHIVKDEDVSNG